MPMIDLVVPEDRFTEPEFETLDSKLTYLIVEWERHRHRRVRAGGMAVGARLRDLAAAFGVTPEHSRWADLRFDQR